MTGIKSQRSGCYGAHNHDEFQVMIKITVWETQESEVTWQFPYWTSSNQQLAPSPAVCITLLKYQK